MPFTILSMKLSSAELPSAVGRFGFRTTFPIRPLKQRVTWAELANPCQNSSGLDVGPALPVLIARVHIGYTLGAG